MLPLISVIIPSYNSEKTIYACLQSIVRQTFTRYEVIVMDGGSLDRTAEIVSSFSGQDFNIQYFCEKDTGIYDAMNKGIDRAKGEWILFLGSDDELFDSHVFWNVFNSTIPPKMLMIYGKALVIPDQWITPLNNTFNDVIRNNVCHQSIFYSRNVFLKWKFDLRYKILADWDLNLKLFANHFSQIRSVDVFICKFLNLGVSASWRTSSEFLMEFNNRNNVYIKYLPWHRAIPRIIKEHVSHFSRNMRSFFYNRSHSAQ